MCTTIRTEFCDPGAPCASTNSYPVPSFLLHHTIIYREAIHGWAHARSVVTLCARVNYCQDDFHKFQDEIWSDKFNSQRPLQRGGAQRSFSSFFFISFFSFSVEVGLAAVDDCRYKKSHFVTLLFVIIIIIITCHRSIHIFIFGTVWF